MDDAFVGIIRRHRLVAPGARVLVGVSGGPDSVALLALLQRNGSRLGIEITAAHLDHCIRPESNADALFVRQLCAGMGVPLVSGAADVPDLARIDREGLEAAGRRARRDFLLAAAAERGCAAIALGHHRGDQAETLLHRLVRGAGGTGLAAMAIRSAPFIRPLLFFPRALLLEFLARIALPFVEDASNCDPRFTRNRIRHELLPCLSSFNPRIEEHLADLAQRFALEEDFWRAREDDALRSVTLATADGLSLAREGLLTLHPALRSRVLRRALAQVRGDLRQISANHLRALEALLNGERPQGELHLPRAWVARRYERLWLREAAPVLATPYAMTIPGVGDFQLPDGGELKVSILEQPGEQSPSAVEFDGTRIDFPLLWRIFRPGDRFCPAGVGGTKKLKSFFIDHKIDRERRLSQPLLVGSEILWLAGLCRCRGYVPETGCRRVLRFVYRAGNR